MSKTKIISMSDKTKKELTRNHNITEDDFETTDINNIRKNKFDYMKTQYYYLKKSPEIEDLKNALIDNYFSSTNKQHIDYTVNVCLHNIYTKFPKLRSKDYTYIEDFNLLKVGDVIEYVCNDLETISEQKVIKVIRKSIDNIVTAMTLKNLNNVVGQRTIRPKTCYIFRYNIDPRRTNEILLLKMQERKQMILEKNREYRERKKMLNGEPITPRKNKQEKLTDFVASVLRESNLIIKNNEFVNMDSENIKNLKEIMEKNNKKIKK